MLYVCKLPSAVNCYVGGQADYVDAGVLNTNAYVLLGPSTGGTCDGAAGSYVADFRVFSSLGTTDCVWTESADFLTAASVAAGSFALPPPYGGLGVYTGGSGLAVPVLDEEGGAEIGGAILLLWSVAWFFRPLRKLIFDR